MSQKRRAYSLKERYEVVKAVERGRNKKSVAEQMGLPRASVIKICKNSDKIIEEYESGSNVQVKRQRKHNFENVDKHLMQWFRMAREKKLVVSGEMLLHKAKEFAAALQHEDSDKIDMNWINRWKKRKEVTCKKLHGEAESVDFAAIDNWLKNHLPQILGDYMPKDIFNADETGLFFKCLPDRTHTLKDEKCAGGKMSKDRLTVLVAASMCGEKLPLLVVGKSTNPRCFKGVKILPAPYQSNKRAWMTGSVFEGWVRKLDKEMKRQHRNIILIVDNCTAHPHIQGLQNVKLAFLPPNTTARTQPMDAGVIKSLKGKYRTELAKKHLAAFELGSQVKIDVLSAMKMLTKSWSAVTEKTIKNCFKKVGFVATETDMEDEPMQEQQQFEEEYIETWRRLAECGVVDSETDLMAYLSTDEDLVTRETITEDTIMEEITDVVDAVQDVATDGENEDDDEPEPPPTLKEALAMLKKLQLFLECDSSIDSINLRNMELLESKLVEKCIGKAKQTKISDFFNKE